MEAAWASLLQTYRGWHGERDLSHIAKAYRLLTDLARAYGSRREDSSPHHALTVGVHVAEFGAEAPVVCAALLHGVFERRDERAHRHLLEQEFGSEVVDLLERTDLLQRQEQHTPAGEEGWRSLVSAAKHDPRLLLLLLAHCLARLEASAAQPESTSSRDVAEHALALYLPLAARLGAVKLQRAFGDLCCRIREPSEYAAAATKLVATVERMRARVRTLEQEVRTLDRSGDILSLECVYPQVADLLLHDGGESGRGEIPESLSVDVVVGSPEKAYRFVLLLHARWKPMAGGFRDFIAHPKASGYQALHTEVLTEQCGRVLFCISTPAMAKRNAYGMLATGAGFQRLATLLTDRDVVTSEIAEEGAGRELVSDQKIVYDDRRQQHAIPAQATALDAAFLLYADAAASTSSVAVDGKPVSFSAPVSEGAVVTIEAADDVQVRTEWLAEVATSTVAFAIQRALKRRSFEEKIQLGWRILQKQFDIVQSGLLVSTLADDRLSRAVRTFGASSFEEILARLAEGVLSATDVYDALSPSPHGERSLRERVESCLNRLLHRVSLDATFAITGRSDACPDAVGTVTALALRRRILLQRETLTVDPGTRTFHLRFSCSAPDRAALFTFLLTLEQELGFTSVRALLPRGRRIAFLSFTGLTLLAWLTPFVTLPLLTTGVSRGLALPLSLLPVAAANILLFHYVRNYVARFRESTTLFLVWGVVNLVALCLFLLFVTYAAPTESQTSLLGVLALFVAVTLFTTYQYLSTHSVFHPPPRGTPLTGEQWRALLRRKVGGYTFRLAAVTIWGLQPLYLKYTAANEVAPFVRVFLMSVGIVLVSAAVATVARIVVWLRGQVGTTLKLPWNRELLGIIVGATFFTYFLNASLRLTTSTNFILFNNVSPVLALLVAALLWRHTIPYLKEPKHVLWVFLTFLMGSVGSVLLIYNSILTTAAGSVLGDVLGMMAMVADTLYVISQIRYMKVIPKAFSPSINLYVFTPIVVFLLPFLGYLLLTGSPLLSTLSLRAVFFVLGAGVLSGIGQILNYETFRRIDGFIAFLMFNISILITFAIEVFALGKFSPTWVLLLGGCTIVGSTILAEVINTRCERRGL